MAVETVRPGKKKVGLALGSGAARGMAHIGYGEFHRAREAIARGAADGCGLRHCR